MHCEEGTEDGERSWLSPEVVQPSGVLLQSPHFRPQLLNGDKHVYLRLVFVGGLSSRPSAVHRRDAGMQLCGLVTWTVAPPHSVPGQRKSF